jgi:D-glycero-D-manno-heptose 1,7-bisphosphate phosphatase
MNKAVFLDRDGTINEEMGYLSDLKQLRLIPGAGAAIKRLNDAGLKVVRH